MALEKYCFPEDFLFGTATTHIRLKNITIAMIGMNLSRIAKNTAHGEISGISTNHWNRYLEDFDLMEKFNVKSYRMSIEWSRIFPKEITINQNALEKHKDSPI